MADINFPDDLIALETTAWEEIQAGALTVDTAAKVQARLTAFAADKGIDRHAAEMELKRVVRHAAAAGQ